MTNPIRTLAHSDLPELIQLCREHAEFERANWDVRDRVSDLAAMFLESSDARCWIVEGNGELAGFASATLERSTWSAGCFLHMDCIYLRPNYRSAGLGRSLMRRVLAAAIEMNALNVQWQTPTWNERAIRFYERLGASSAAKVRFTMTPDECVTALREDGASHAK